MEIRPEEFASFAEWFQTALWFFVITVPIIVFLTIFGSYLNAAIRRGPVEAFYRVAHVIFTAVGREIPRTSPRRVMAMVRLTIKESIRRRIVVGFIIWVLVFLFAGWFLDPQSDDPAHLYLSFVLTVTNYLVIALALFLATASLPADIKSKTIYTIVTKPVQCTEIVLGRVLGFCAVISALLVIMCVISYIFVYRHVEHTHEVEVAGMEGVTTTDSASPHFHAWNIDAKGIGETDVVKGHKHVVVRSPEDATKLTVGAQEGSLQARVPIYGDLRFLDREGNPADAGVSVGKEWEYRSYIEGRSLATAIWKFEDISEADFPDGLPIAMTLSVFRTHKGDIKTRVRGVIIVSSTDPRNPLQCEPIGFESQEFSTQHLKIPRKLRPVGADGTSGREIDLFDDLVRDGEVEIWIRCDDSKQFFGVAQSDLFIRAADASFAWNFVKAYIGIWLQMIIVVCLGVTFSTFVNSPVAIMGTVLTVVLGFFGKFVRDLWTGEAFGGGPVEAMIRLVKQDNLVKPLEFGVGEAPVQAVKFVDAVVLFIMNLMSAVLPDFSSLGRVTEYVAYNFNYYDGLLARQCLTTFLYVTAITIVDYFFLKTREIAA